MKHLTILLSSIFIISCSTILGIRLDSEILIKDEINNQFISQNIKENQRFILNENYTQKLKSDYKTYEESETDSNKINEKKTVLKDNLQPVQVRYFNKKGTQIFKLVNCYVPKGKKWNVNDCFEEFPPRTVNKNLNNFEYELDFFLNNIMSIDGKKIKQENLPNSEFYAIVFWNDIVYKSSNELIKTIKEYNLKNSDKQIYTMFVNNHNVIHKLLNE